MGSNTPVAVDIRLICATNRDLFGMVARGGEFREDLLYRINTIHLEIPALRERQEDIIPLAERFIIRFCKQYGKPALRLDNAAREKLFQLEREGRAMVFAPHSTRGFSRTERDVEKIRALWQDGCDQGRERLAEVRAFWGQG